MWETAERLGLAIKLDNSSIIVFRNGGHIASCEKWMYGENVIQIQPMLNNGAEVWGLEADHTPIERIHIFAVKTFLNTSIRTPNVMVYGETGRCPLFMSTYVK